MERPQALHRSTHSRGLNDANLNFIQLTFTFAFLGSLPVRRPKLPKYSGAHPASIPVRDARHESQRLDSEETSIKRTMGTEQRRRHSLGQNWQSEFDGSVKRIAVINECMFVGKLWRRLQGEAEINQKRCRGKNLPDDAARRAEAEVPPGRKNLEAIRPPEHRQAHRNLRSEAADYDRHGAGRGRIAVDVPAEKRCVVGPATDDEHVQGHGGR